MSQTFRYSKGDVRIAFLLGLCLFFLAALQLNGGQSLANDAGAYMNTALAISEGRMEEQDRLNLLMHPSPLSFAGEEAESLTYSWGYPLLLALVHRFAGFDTTAFDTIIFYKLPVAAAYALLGAVMYLFCRRRFSATASITLSALLMLNPLLMEQLNVISPELPFLLFFLLSLLTAETYAASPGMRKGILLGFWLFCCCVVRLNGISVIFIVLLIHVLSRNRSPGHRAFRIVESTPYLSCGLFFLVSLLFLPQPTSNLSDVGHVTFRYFQQNLFSYYCVYKRRFTFFHFATNNNIIIIFIYKFTCRLHLCILQWKN
jgi:hypothetical protein